MALLIIALNLLAAVALGAVLAVPMFVLTWGWVLFRWQRNLARSVLRAIPRRGLAPRKDQ